MRFRNKIALAAVAAAIGTATMGNSRPVYASDAGAFIGGVFATKLLTNMSEQTKAQQAQASAAQARPVPQAAPVHPAPAKQTAEQRMAELDKLAAGGYITPEEYKKKKQAIIDSL